MVSFSSGVAQLCSLHFFAFIGSPYLFKKTWLSPSFRDGKILNTSARRSSNRITLALPRVLGFPSLPIYLDLLIDIVRCSKSTFAQVSADASDGRIPVWNKVNTQGK